MPERSLKLYLFEVLLIVLSETYLFFRLPKHTLQSNSYWCNVSCPLPFSHLSLSLFCCVCQSLQGTAEGTAAYGPLVNRCNFWDQEEGRGIKDTETSSISFISIATRADADCDWLNTMSYLAFGCFRMLDLEKLPSPLGEIWITICQQRPQKRPCWKCLRDQSIKVKHI